MQGEEGVSSARAPSLPPNSLAVTSSTTDWLRRVPTKRTHSRCSPDGPSCMVRMDERARARAHLQTSNHPLSRCSALPLLHVKTFFGRRVHKEKGVCLGKVCVCVRARATPTRRRHASRVAGASLLGPSPLLELPRRKVPLPVDGGISRLASSQFRRPGAYAKPPLRPPSRPDRRLRRGRRQEGGRRGEGGGGASALGALLRRAVPRRNPHPSSASPLRLLRIRRPKASFGRRDGGASSSQLALLRTVEEGAAHHRVTWREEWPCHNRLPPSPSPPKKTHHCLIFLRI